MQDRQIRKLKGRMAELEKSRSGLIDELKQPPPYQVVVGGEVKENVVIKVLRFRGFRQTPEGTTEMEREWSEAKIVGTENGLMLVTRDFDNNTEELPVEADALKQGVFEVVDGKIEWRQGSVDELMT